MNRYVKTEKLERGYEAARLAHQGQRTAFNKLFWQQLRNLIAEVRAKKRLAKMRAAGAV